MSEDRMYVARLKRQGMTFELVIDPAIALKALEGQAEPVEALRDEEVFHDVEKGIRASLEDVERAFGTHDLKRIAREIFAHGEVQLTAEQRRQMRERLAQHVVSEIARLAVDPRSGLPHPPQRIRLALEEAKWHVDEALSLEKNVERAVKALRPVLPIKLTRVTYEIRIPAVHVGHAYGVVRKHGEVKKEEYSAQGDWIVTIEIPGGLRDELMDAVNKATHGEAVFKELGTRDA